MNRIVLFLLFTSVALSSLAQKADTKSNYQNAFVELQQMLDDEIPVSFKRAVFITENAYVDSKLKYEEFYLKYINDLVSLTKIVAASDDKFLIYDKKDRQQVLLSASIFRVMKDSLFTMKPDKNKHFIKYPYLYDMEDFWGERDWTKMFVSKLLYTQTGNCHSLPLLYKILAEELGVKAWLAVAPSHTYIKQWNDKTGWYNTELTTGHFPYDKDIKLNSYIPTEAIADGVFMDTLSAQENIAYILTDLAQGFVKKFGYEDIQSPINWLNVALKHYPDNVNALILKAELQKKQYEKLMFENGIYEFNRTPKDSSMKQSLAELERSYFKIHQMGYRKMPKEMYLNWLFRVQKDTTRKPYQFATPQPFKKYNYNVQVVTAGDGRNYEFFDQDTVTRIGTVELNTTFGKITRFVEHEPNDIRDEVISRSYDPAIGKFWQIDPLAEEFYSDSPYNYALNNPINNVDPDGMAPIGVNGDDPNTIASTFIRPDGTIIEHRDDDDFGIYVVTDEDAWAKGGKTSEGLTMVGIENRAYQYTPGQKINLLDQNQNRLAPSPGTIDPDYTLESIFIPLFGWLKGAKILRFGGATFKVTSKIAGQMAKRGWTDELINGVLKNPYASRAAMNKATKNQATAYFAKDGSYVVVDNVTKDVIQISDKTDPSWFVDNTIINPYIPKK